MSSLATDFIFYAEIFFFIQTALLNTLYLECLWLVYCCSLLFLACSSSVELWCAVKQWPSRTSKVSCGSVFYCAREVSVHWLSAAETAGSTGSRSKWWTATSRPALLRSLSLRPGRSGQSRHRHWNLLHQEVVCHNAGEISCLWEFRSAVCSMSVRSG